MSSEQDAEYERLLEEGRRLNEGIRIGTPGRTRAWPIVHPLMHVLRLRFAVDIEGAELMSEGPAIIVENHQSGWDPFVTVVRTDWRVSALAKREIFETPAGILMRLVGQIPITRGDDAQTDWALAVANLALSEGMKVGIYPEGTRGPDRDALYRLHQRALVPLLRANPEVPVHAITVRYAKRGLRVGVQVRVSAPLPVDRATMSDDEMVAVIRDAMIAVSGLRYVDEPAWTAKKRARAAARKAAEGGATG